MTKVVLVSMLAKTTSLSHFSNHKTRTIDCLNCSQKQKKNSNTMPLYTEKLPKVIINILKRNLKNTCPETQETLAREIS